MSEESTNQFITKKNEGRVAAGKRLAEWNRKNKANVQKNVGKSTSPDDQEPATGSSKFPDSAYLYSAGGLAVILTCVGVGFYIFRKQPAPQHVETPEPLPLPTQKQKQTRQLDIDIFKMS